MFGRLLRRSLLATGIALVVWMVIRKLNEPAPQPATGTAAWPPLETTAPVGGPVAAAPTGSGWVEPDNGQCPATHPVKGKLSSGIYHEPDGAAYDRTRADRCYADPQAAEVDGLRASKI